MTRRSTLRPDAAERLLAAADPLPAGALPSPEIDSALDDIGAAIMVRPREAAPRRRWQWAGSRRLVMVLGTTVAVAGGGVAAASQFLSAHTGTYPRTRADIRSGGAGENLNLGAADGLSVALQVSSPIPYPHGYQSWRDWLARIQVQESAPQPCPPDVHQRTCPSIVSTDALRARFAVSAACAWIVDWRRQTLAGRRAAAAMDGAQVTGTVNAPRLGWLGRYRSPIRAGNVTAVDRLLAASATGSVCWGYDPAFAGRADGSRSPGAAFISSLDRVAP
jgi:hypothetical protein